MKIIYLGTAAAEAIPALFCECTLCENARKTLGKEFRSRSGIVINDTLLVDVPPDLYHSSIRAGVRLPDIENIVVTHSHSDHFAADELVNRDYRCFCERKPEHNYTVNLYGNEAVGAVYQTALDRFGQEINGVKYAYLAPFVPIQLGTVTVTPLLASHMPNEACYLYLFEEDGKRFLYGNDTGLFPQATLDYLKDTSINVISLDCTFAVKKCEHGHMGILANAKMKNCLLTQHSADENTVWICHHFSHNGFRLEDGTFYDHDAFAKIAGQYGFIPSYDTMEITL